MFAVEGGEETQMSDTPLSGTGFGTTTGSDFGGGEHVCPTCGAKHSAGLNRGLEQFLGRLGISEEMVNNLKSSMQSVDIEEYLNTAREYLKNGSDKATTYAKENPGKVAAGVAVLAVGAGLLISALKRE
jgi:hypothetical protein